MPARGNAPGALQTTKTLHCKGRIGTIPLLTRIGWRTRENDCFDCIASTNPPVLHRKETFLTAGHPLHAKFARLTQQEEKHGLLDDSSAIGTRDGWSSRLAERGFALKGHRLVKVNAEEAGL
jgi:hypothetical protein